MDCIAYGPLVAVVVATLKRIPWLGAAIARNPKLVAMIASGLTIAITGGVVPASSAQWLTFAQCVAAAFAGAVGMHEVALDPLAKLTGLAASKRAR